MAFHDIDRNIADGEGELCNCVIINCVREIRFRVHCTNILNLPYLAFSAVWNNNCSSGDLRIVCGVQGGFGLREFVQIASSDYEF